MDRPKLRALFLFLAVVLPQQTRAQSYPLERGTINLDLPADWQEVRDLFGMPLMFLGPAASGGRWVLSVTATGKTQVSMDAASLKRSEGEYRKGREAWLEKFEGEALSFSGYQTEKWKYIGEVHTIGYRYRLHGVEFAENSYFVTCKTQLFHLKTLLPRDPNRSPSQAGDAAARAQKTFQTLLNSFKCE